MVEETKKTSFSVWRSKLQTIKTMVYEGGKGPSSKENQITPYNEQSTRFRVGTQAVHQGINKPNADQD